MPISLLELTFGEYFNQSVDALAPLPFLTKVKFNDKFNKSIDKLPDNITHLTLGKDFSVEVSKLPASLTHFTFHGTTKVIWKALKTASPAGLTHVTVKAADKYEYMPPSVTHFNDKLIER